MGLFDNFDPFGIRSTTEKNNAYREEARTGLNQQAALNNALGNLGMQNYGASTAQMGQTTDYLGGLMRGQNSVAAEQLRQGLGQQLAAQRSMAASASPQNAAMAARTAAMQMGRLGAGMSGQAALAGLQERNQAAGQLGQLQLGMRGQDVNAALGGYGGATQAYGAMLAGPEYQNRLQGAQPLFGALGAALKASGGGGG